MTGVIEGREPLNVKCESCGHTWPVAYTPMPLSTFVEVVASARCPSCGATTADMRLLEEPANAEG